MVKVKNTNKKVLTIILSMMMVLSMPVVSNAASVGTGVHSSSFGYTLYVRKTGANDVLGYMYLSHTSTKARNAFTAEANCKSTTAAASYTNSGYKVKSVASLPKNASVIAEKTGSGITKTYGYCTVGY